MPLEHKKGYFLLYNDTSAHLFSGVHCYAPVLIRFIMDSAKREYFNGLSSNHYLVWLRYVILLESVYRHST